MIRKITINIYLSVDLESYLIARNVFGSAPKLQNKTKIKMKRRAPDFPSIRLLIELLEVLSYCGTLPFFLESESS